MFAKNSAAGSISGVLVFMALLAFVPGCRDENFAPPQMPVPQVGVVELQAVNVPSVIELTGRAASRAAAEVRPQVSGIILRRMFDEGSNVSAGQQLYQIDPALYQAQYDTARANELKAQTAVENAKKIVDRYTEIIKVKGVSQQEFDTASATYNQGVSELAAARAAIKTARINLDYTRVYSPVSGRAGISSVTEGTLVTAGQPGALVHVQQMDPMYIDITQSSAEFLRLQRALKDGSMVSGGAMDAGGKEVDLLKVRLVLEDGKPYIMYKDGRPVLDDDGNPAQHEATLMLYEATVDRSTGSITMRAVVDNPDHLILPGMFVRATVTEGIIENALLVPLEVVTRTPRGEAQVKIVGKEGKIEERLIESTRIFENRAWIVLPGFDGGARGLEVGDKLVVEGLNRVRAGMPAQTYPAGSRPAPEAPVPAPSGGDSR